MHDRILVIEDDTALQAMLAEALTEKGYDVVGAGSAEEGIERLKAESFDLVLSDVRLPGITGLDAIPAYKEAAPHVDVIVMTAYSTRDVAVEAVKLGAYDYFSKPFRLAEMEVVVRRALEKRRLSREVADLREAIRRVGPTGRVIGQGPAMSRVLAVVEKIAGLDSTVLITGESGTGKELISDTLHALSPRSGGPFVKVNCAAIPENLLESELFGHEKGAFTGAMSAKTGKFEQAIGGTILLDEIGDMPLSLQAKLLRVVEQKQVERLGGKGPIDVDVRIVAATNQDLLAMVGEKTFRGDLYYRLNVASLHLPPLRERKEDIPLLAEFFLDRVNAKLGTRYLGMTPDAVEELIARDWPGNVRQFANLVERAAIIGEGQYLSATEIRLAFNKELSLAPADGSGNGDGKPTSLSETLREVEKNLIEAALRRHHGRQTDAAKALGVSPKNLWNKLQKHGLNAADYAE